MNIVKQTENNVVTLALEGWLDTQTAPELGAELDTLDGGADSLVLDFGKLEYISSAGLRQVVAAYKKMSGRMKVINVSNEIMEVFKMTGFDTKLNIE